MAVVVRLIHTLFSLYSIALIGRTFMEMLLGPYHAVVVFLRQITEPLLAPIRRYVRPVQSGGMAWDLSPMVLLLLMWVVEQVLVRILYSLA